MSLYAHTPNPQGVWHDLSEHLQNTADRAEYFASRLGIEGIAKVAGLFHDLGKSHPLWQTYLQAQIKKAGKRDHSSAGAVYASNSLSSLGVIVSWLIAGHHSGLANLNDLKGTLEKKAQVPEIQEAIRMGMEFLAAKGIKLSTLPESVDPSWGHIENAPHSCEIFIRMLFSCLTDADYLDTEEHFYGEQRSELRKSWKASLEELWNKLEAFCSALHIQSEKNPLNLARQEIFHHCIKAAGRPTGVYKLSVPTGLGKTLSSMGFGLQHALQSQKDRVIVAVPYTSIIDQSSQIYREVFGQEHVLEHHSGVDISSETLEGERIKLASENWDVPVIVTTTVQLFESLFANKPARVRKLHNIANSVVILDEFQMLPLELLEPIFSMIKELTLYYNVTFLLSSATPLALDLGSSALLQKQAILPPSESIIPHEGRYFEQFRRVEYEVETDKQVEWGEVAERLLSTSQGMVIVNRRIDAQILYRLISEEGKALHLSGLMCGAHRKQVLGEVRKRLNGGEPVHLVTTSLVECGVDIDFPFVMRAMGPLDRIVQAAGRCNREGKFEKGKVVVFDPADGGIPSGSYSRATSETRLLLNDPSCNLHDPNLYEKYFRRLYQSVDTDGKKVEHLRQNHPPAFAEIARLFRMIDADTVHVVWQYDARAKELLDDFKETGRLTRTWMREIQPYVVSLYVNNRIFTEQSGNLQLLTEGWYEWTGHYDKNLGLLQGMNYDCNDLIVS